MAKQYPKYPNEVADGDEPTYSPKKTHTSLLASQRGTQYTRRLETDEDSNLLVNVAKNSAFIRLLAHSEISSVPKDVLSTILTFSASSDTLVSKIHCSGSVYAKYFLCLNTQVIDVKRSSPSRNVEFEFNIPLLVEQDEIIEVKVKHYFENELADFEASIYG